MYSSVLFSVQVSSLLFYSGADETVWRPITKSAQTHFKNNNKGTKQKTCRDTFLKKCLRKKYVELMC
jgi:hypothetical protein